MSPLKNYTKKRGSTPPLLVRPLSILSPIENRFFPRIQEEDDEMNSDVTFAGYEVHGFRGYGDFAYEDVQRIITKRKLKSNESYAILLNAEVYIDKQERDTPGRLLAADESYRRSRLVTANAAPEENQVNTDRETGIFATENNAWVEENQGSTNGMTPQVVFLVHNNELRDTNYNFATNNAKIKIRGTAYMEQYNREDDTKIYFRTVLLSTNPALGSYSLVQTVEKKTPNKRSRLESDDPEMSKKLKAAIELLKQADMTGKDDAKVLIKNANLELRPYMDG